MAAARDVKEEGLQNSLLARIAADPAFGLAMEELDALLVPGDYTGLAGEQVEAYLKGEAGDILLRFAFVPQQEAKVSL